MAIFGSKKKKEINAAAEPKGAVAVSAKAPVVVGVRAVIRRPRLTEKAANMTSNNVYTFDVTLDATKHDIVRAVKALYKVTPKKVAVVNTKGKRVSLRTRRGSGVRNRTRKAYVYLRAGDKIDFAA